jgi:hypothetical protein
VAFGSVAFTTTGSVDIFEQSGLQLSGSSTAGALILNSATDITDYLASITVSGSAHLTAPALSLLDEANESLSVAGNMLFESSTGGAFTVSEAGSAQFGSLTIRTGGNAQIHEDGVMTLVGSSTAGTLELYASESLTDGPGVVAVTGDAVFGGNTILLANAVGEQLQIAGNMRLTSTGGAITVDTQGTVNFGSLSFTSTSPISVTEDSSTDFLGSSTAGSLNITSSSTVSDSAGGAAQIYVSENVSLN